MKGSKVYIIFLSIILITSGLIGFIHVSGASTDTTDPSDTSVHYTIVNSSPERISMTGELHVQSNHDIKSVTLKRGTNITVEQVNSSTYRIHNFTHSSVSNTTDESIFELPRLRIQFKNGEEYTTLHNKTTINTSVNNTDVFTSQDGVFYQTQYAASKNVYKNMTYITPDSHTVDTTQIETFYTDTESFVESPKPVFVFIGADKRRSLTAVKYKDSVFIKKPDRLRSLPHELIHVYQNHRFGDDMQWAREAFPNYLRHYVFARSYDKNQSVVYYKNNNPLFNKQSKSYTSYTYGSKVLHFVDIHLQKNTNKTMYDIFRWMNAQNQTITYDIFRQKIVSETNQHVGENLDKYVYHGDSIPIEHYYITSNETIVRKNNKKSTTLQNGSPQKDIVIKQKLNKST